MSFSGRRTRTILAFLALLFVFLHSLTRGHAHIAFWAVRKAFSTRETYVANYLDNDMSGPYDGTPLKEICRRAEWREGLIIKCGRINGGIGNVRNGILTCVRLAIAAGGNSSSYPSISIFHN